MKYCFQNSEDTSPHNIPKGKQRNNTAMHNAFYSEPYWHKKEVVMIRGASTVACSLDAVVVCLPRFFHGLVKLFKLMLQTISWFIYIRLQIYIIHAS